MSLPWEPGRLEVIFPRPKNVEKAVIFRVHVRRLISFFSCSSSTLQVGRVVIIHETEKN